MPYDKNNFEENELEVNNRTWSGTTSRPVRSILKHNSAGFAKMDGEEIAKRNEGIPDLTVVDNPEPRRKDSDESNNSKNYRPRFTEKVDIVNEADDQKNKQEIPKSVEIVEEKSNGKTNVDLTFGEVLQQLARIIRKNWKEIRLNLLLLVLVLIMLIPSILFAVLNEPADPYQYEMTSYATVWPLKQKLVLYHGDNEKGPKVQINWGNSVPPLSGVPTMCKSKQPWCYTWSKTSSLLLTSLQPVVGIDCIKVQWMVLAKNYVTEFSDCFLMDNKTTYWYGGPAGVNTIWPIDNGDYAIGSLPLLTGDVQTSYQNLYGAQEPFWVSSTGFSVLVNKHYPLRVNQTNSMTCLQSVASVGHLEYAVCRGPDPASLILHRQQMENIFDSQKSNTVQFSSKISFNNTKFTTIVTVDARNVQVDDVLQLIDVLNTFNLSFVVMFEYFDFLDDSMSKNLLNIFNITKLSSYYPTAIETSNFIKVSYADANVAFWERYCVLQRPTGIRRQETPSTVGTVLWRDFFYFVIDFTLNDVRMNFFDMVRNNSVVNVVQYLSFTGGTAEELPIEPTLNLTNENLNVYSTFYAESVSMFPNTISISTGYGTQNLDNLHIDVPVAVQNVTSIIPLFLTLSIQGYSYLILHLFDQEADMILSGQNNLPVNYVSDLKAWFQIAMYLPLFRIPAQMLGTETFQHVYSQHESVRRNTVLPYYVKAVKNQTTYGYPIFKPIWWSDSKNEAFIADNQFMIGDDLVVAAFLSNPTYNYKVYLPVGYWKDPVLQHCSEGGQMISLHGPFDIICFERVFNSTECSTS